MRTLSLLKRGFVLVLAATTMLAVVLAANTWRQPSRQHEAAAVPPISLEIPQVAQRLSGALRFETISRQGEIEVDGPAFDGMQAYLQQQFPLLHEVLAREVINGHSLLYRWEGSDPGARPILLMAHQDVVPVSPGSEKDWTFAPFSGAIRGGYIWGRGAWDDKGSLLSIMEAVELLVARGFRPRQTVYLAFGHDEENGGEHGSKAIAAALKARGVHLQFVLDEGLFVTEGLFPGLEKPLALVGTAEKGFVTLKLSVAAVPGHSSAPAANGAIARLSRALVRLDEAPLPAEISGVTAEMLDTIAPEMPLSGRFVLSNRWLFGPLVTRQLAKSPGTAAMLRTTTALTVVRAGNKENVLPGEASALVNFRTMPGNSLEDVLTHVKATVNDDAVQVSVQGDSHRVPEPTPAGAVGYRLIEETIGQVYPGIFVAPGLLVGGTDSRHFAPIADEIYRFTPVRVDRQDLAQFHGTNERISVANYVEMIHFYVRLLVNTTGGSRLRSAEPAPENASS